MSNIIGKNIGALTIEKLFEENLKIPYYQRPYSWENEQVEDIIEDLLDAYKNKKDNYLIGNMIFHQEEDSKEEINIVDGQQRTITLALIIKILDIKEDNFSKFFQNKISILSSNRLIENYNLIKNRLKADEKLLNYILKEVIVTYIKTSSEDEAFVLFDSQNTRGRPLERKDLLKVHHLHHMEKENIELNKREKYAIKWEEIEKVENEENKENNLNYIFETLISLPRLAIRGELKKNHINSIDVFKEFKTKSSKSELNKYNQPSLFKDFYYDFKSNEATYQFIDEIKIYFGNKLFVEDILTLPFEISQSIIGGERFFWFILKYYKLLKKLKEEEAYSRLDSIYGTGNLYLRKIYKSIIFFYIDKFGYYKFDDFVKVLSKLFVLIRLHYPRVYLQTVVEFKWDKQSSLDIYKLIFLNSSSEDVIAEIEKYILYADKADIKIENEEYSYNGEKISDTQKYFIDKFAKEIIESLIGKNNG